jgi:hypothetical protein
MDTAQNDCSTRGCGLTRTATPAPPLDDEARRRRLRMGLAMLALAGLLAAGACHAWLLWPLAGVAGWFAASFLVAAATRYPGCPELGAIPSLLLRRRIRTRCGPLAGR